MQLREQLSHSVPLSLIEDANRQYTELVCKYQALLQQVMAEGEEEGKEVGKGKRIRMLSEQLMQAQAREEQLREQLDGE